MSTKEAKVAATVEIATQTDAETERVLEGRDAANGTVSVKSNESFVDRFERDFHQGFLDPAFDDMKKSMDEMTAMLQKTNEKLDRDREEEMRKRNPNRRDIPGPLEGDGRKLEDIVNHLQDLILSANYKVEEIGSDDSGTKDDSNLGQAMDEARERIRPIEVDEAAHMAMTSQYLAAFVSTMPPDHVKKLSTRVLSDVTLWLSRLFRFFDASAYYHMDDREGIVKMCRLALNKRYEKFATDGFNALYAKPPVIYVSSAGRLGLGHYVCQQLGLPLSCLCSVPCNTVFGSQHTMDISTLEKLIEEDEASSKTPLFLVGNSGTPAAGHSDNFKRLGEVCASHQIWLHIEGHNLGTLSLGAPPTSVLYARKADSITLLPGTWLGLPSTPGVTLYRAADPALSLASGLCSSQVFERLIALPLWVCLQYLGLKGINRRIKKATDLSLQFAQKLNVLTSIHMTDKIPKREKELVIQGNWKEVLGSVLSIFMQEDVISTIVVFKYGESKEAPGPEVAPYARAQAQSEGSQADSSEKMDNLEEEETEDSVSQACVFDSFNKWLFEKLQADNPRVKLELIELEREGVCIQFSPLESASLYGTTPDHINELAECLQQYIPIITATLDQVEPFEAEVAATNGRLVLAEVHGVAGIGNVQYIPEYLEAAQSIGGESQVELDKINREIFQQLVSALPEGGEVYSLERTAQGTACISVGMVASSQNGLNAKSIVEHIYTIGLEVEDSTQFMERMTKTILEGIESANQDLQKEQENKLMQEGVLRQVPIVSSIVNWWSPPPKDVLKGRSYDLTSGHLESTETIYKYHMQIEGGNNSPKKMENNSLAANETPQAEFNGNGIAEAELADVDESR